MLLKGKLKRVSVKVWFFMIICACILLPATLQALTQSEIVAAMGAGWNVGNQLEANSGGTPSETVWGNPLITQSLITAVKNAGFKSLRIPISYLSKIGAAPSYTIDPTWLARIKQVVDYAYNIGMYVMINIHGDGYTSVTGAWLLVNSSDQTTINAKYKAVWQQVANYFISYDEKLIFESMNEVFDGNYGTPNTTYYSNLNTYNQNFVDTVRQTGGNNASRWLLIPGWNTNIDYTVGSYGFVLPTDNYRSSTIPSSEKRIMISAHYYSPWDFCGQEDGTITQWGSIATNPSKVSTWGQEDYMDSQIKAMYDKFVTQGYPVVIGEYGSIDKTVYDSTNNTYRQYFGQTLAADCKKYGAVPVYWDNGWNGQHGFGLFDRNTYAITQQGIITAILNGMGGTTVTPAPTAVPTTASDTVAPTSVPTATPGPTTVPTATPAGVTADPTTPPTTVTDAPTTPPTVTADPTSPPATGCTCTNLCTSQTSITVPFTKDGTGEYCYTATSLASYVNSWNTDAVNINGTNCTNTYVSSSSIPAISGVYYIYYKGSYSWSHLEIK